MTARMPRDRLTAAVLLEREPPVSFTNCRDTIQMGTNAEKPLFHVILSDRDLWVVEAEWPDGVLERIQTFQSHTSAATWVATQSEAWKHVQRISDVVRSLKDQD